MLMVGCCCALSLLSATQLMQSSICFNNLPHSNKYDKVGGWEVFSLSTRFIKKPTQIDAIAVKFKDGEESIHTDDKASHSLEDDVLLSTTEVKEDMPGDPFAGVTPHSPGSEFEANLVSGESNESSDDGGVSTLLSVYF